ncbi:hypothetical protein F4809DRAFT_649213 [Biscogniauxia mediterranea]|nr:hypothetical protein F4809DRAFT_649213 [Biscogniauxia mediterranea]
MDPSLDLNSLEDILNSPFLQPPLNQVSNLNDPPRSNGIAIVAITLCIAISTICYLLRAYTRIFCVKKARCEDYLGLIGYAFFIAATGILASEMRGIGFFVHGWDVRLRDLESFLYNYVIATILYCFAGMFIKMAILLEWTHIFITRSNRNSFFWTCHVMIYASCALYITTVITTNLACIPRERIWRRWIPGTCINLDVFNLFFTTFHLIFNILMLLLPHQIIWKLSLTIRQKVGVSMIFSVGIFACACAVGRVVSAVRLSRTEDKTFAYSGYLLWNLAEMSSAILVFCIPSIPIAFRRTNGIARIGSKLRILIGRRDRLKTRRHSWPQTAHDNTLVGEYRVMDEDSHLHLTELNPVRSEESRHEEAPIYNYMGILKTTEIQVTTYRETDTESSKRQHQQGVFTHSWFEH